MVRGRQPGVLWDARAKRFYCRLTVGGKRRQFTLGSTLEEAGPKFKSLLVKYRDNVVHVPRRQGQTIHTVADACAAYIDFKGSDSRCSAEHLKNIQHHLKVLQEFVTESGCKMADIPIDDLAPEHLQSYLATQSLRGWSPAYCRHAAVHAKGALRHAVRSGAILRDPWAIVSRPHVEKKRKRILLPEETAAILQAATGRDRAFLTILYETIARPSEVARSRWEYMEGDRIVLRKHKTSAKTGKPRVLLLSEAAQSALRLYGSGKTGIIFPSSHGNVLNRVAIQRMLKRAIAVAIDAKLDEMKRPTKAKLKKAREALEEQYSGVTPYTFRHTGTTELVESGCDPKTASEITGHSVRTLLEDYVWPSKAHVKAALESRRPKRIPLLRVQVVPKDKLN